MENGSESLEVNITRLDPDEWPAYKALRLEALESEPQAFGASYTKSLEHPDATWRERLVTSQTGVANFMLFAQLGDRTLVGLIGGSIWDDPTVAVITAMYVSPSARGKGVARRLMQGLLNELATNEGLKTAKLTVNKTQLSAVGLCESFGFRTVKETDEVMGDGNCYAGLVMEKKLDRDREARTRCQD